MENFYSLKREHVLHIDGGKTTRAQLSTPKLAKQTLCLRKSDIWKNLAVLVALPYLKRKLDEGYEIYVSSAAIVQQRFRQDDSLQPNANLRQRFLFCYKWFLRNVYPSVNAAYYFTLLAFSLVYLFDGTRHHSPFMWLLGIKLRRMSPEDYRSIELLSNVSKKKKGRAHRTPWISLLSPWNFGRVASRPIFPLLRYTLPASIFALRFLEWWHASDFARQLSRKSIEGIELPPPIISRMINLPGVRAIHNVTKASDSESSLTDKSVQATLPDENYNTKLSLPPISAEAQSRIFTVSLPSSSSLCPICKSRIRTPTAAPTGYVYCYICIYKWVDGSHEDQNAFAEGTKSAEGWGEDEGTAEWRWESGQGRCAVTGLKILGGTEVLRRIIT